MCLKTILEELVNETKSVDCVVEEIKREICDIIDSGLCGHNSGTAGELVGTIEMDIIKFIEGG